MRRYDSGEGIIKIQHNTDQDTTGEDTWLVVQKQLTDASKVQENPLHNVVNPRRSCAAIKGYGSTLWVCVGVCVCVCGCVCVCVSE